MKRKLGKYIFASAFIGFFCLSPEPVFSNPSSIFEEKLECIENPDFVTPSNQEFKYCIKDNGEITTFSPSTYKIPAVSDIPKEFNVEIFKDGNNKENVVNKSKTTGEPPLMLAMSVFFAIKDAIASVGNYKKIPNLNAPATPENILMSIKKIKKNRSYGK